MTLSESERLLELIDQCGSKAKRGLDTFRDAGELANQVHLLQALDCFVKD